MAFAEAHRLGLFTVLWCYMRNAAFTKDGVNYEVSADLTGQANHLGVTIEADIIKQKQPENNGGYNAIGFGKTDPLVYDELTTDHPIDLTRWQVVNCYAGRIGLINSGGESKGDSDLAQAVRTAVINKRAGGMGLIVGRKAFQRPMAEGAALIHTIQDVYLERRGHHRLMVRATRQRHQGTRTRGDAGMPDAFDDAVAPVPSGGTSTAEPVDGHLLRAAPSGITQLPDLTAAGFDGREAAASAGSIVFDAAFEAGAS